MLLRPINVAIVDDHVMFRETLKDYLSEQTNVNVSLRASGIPDLLRELKQTSVDVLLMDVFMPEMNGNDALGMILNCSPGLKILVLSMSTDMNLISEMLDAGIHGYISKADDPQELLLAIRNVSEGRLFHSRLFTEALYYKRENNTRQYKTAATVSFNEREKKILQMLWEEKSNKEIANELFLGVRSIEKIRQDMKEKIGVKSTIGLLKHAINQRVIEVELKKNGLMY